MRGGVAGDDPVVGTAFRDPAGEDLRFRVQGVADVDGRCEADAIDGEVGVRPLMLRTVMPATRLRVAPEQTRMRPHWVWLL